MEELQLVKKSCCFLGKKKNKQNAIIEKLYATSKYQVFPKI